MGGEVPSAAGLRHAADQLRRGEHVDPAVLTDAADELVRLRAEMLRWETVVEIVTRRADAELELVEMMREWRARSQADIDRVLAVVDRPHGQDGQ